MEKKLLLRRKPPKVFAGGVPEKCGNYCPVEGFVFSSPASLKKDERILATER